MSRICICIYIYRICDSICTTHKTFQLFRICDTCISLDLTDLTEYIHTTYSKQLGGFVHGVYAITYYIYVNENANAAHTYPYYIFYLNGPFKYLIWFIVWHIFFHQLWVCNRICSTPKFNHILNKCGQFCVGLWATQV